MNWHRPSKHWAEVEAGTIGAGTFPEATLRALDLNVEGAPLAHIIHVGRAPASRIACLRRIPTQSAYWQYASFAGSVPFGHLRLGDALRAPASRPLMNNAG